MNIRDPKACNDGRWDWEFLNECFAPTKIRLSDIDGFVERNGHVLILEGKRPNAPIDSGSGQAFSTFIDLGVDDVLIVRGDPSPTGRPSICGLYSWRWQRSIGSSIADVQRVVRNWFVEVATMERPPRMPVGWHRKST